MTFIHIATSESTTVEMVQGVEQKVGPRDDIQGLLIETYGMDGDVLRRVTVWDSQAHKDRYEAQQLLPVFESLGVASDVAANTQFATCSWPLRPPGLTVFQQPPAPAHTASSAHWLSWPRRTPTT